ncbi:MAG: hypothetical protein ACI9VR_002977 [Cognaticolwellia sp.]|jgi:uncharacterized protein YndB with AHSA1/START domain
MTRLLALGALLFLSACRPPVPPPAAADPAPVNGEVQKLDAIQDANFLQYSVATHIDAPPQAVWAVLTNARAYTEWNSTVVSVEGEIVSGGEIALVSTLDPERTFELQISTFEAPTTLVWQDGGNTFKGVRTFTLTPRDGGTDLGMREALNGTMMKMIAPSLPDFGPSFEQFVADLKAEVEKG